MADNTPTRAVSPLTRRLLRVSQQVAEQSMKAPMSAFDREQAQANLDRLDSELKKATEMHAYLLARNERERTLFEMNELNEELKAGNLPSAASDASKEA